MEEFLRRDEHEKLYLKLYEILKMKIEKGEWTVGIQIPTEEQLCKNYDVSRATVRNAISELVREGYLKRIQGKGTFVVKKVTPRESITINLKDIMKEHGTFYTKVLAKTVMTPPEEIVNKLELSDPTTHLIYINRLCYLNDEPTIIQYSYIPYKICPSLIDEDFEKNFLIDIIERKCNYTITHIHNHIGISYLNEREQELLNSRDNPVALTLEQFYYSYDKKIYYNQTLKKNDDVKLFVELRLY